MKSTERTTLMTLAGVYAGYRILDLADAIPLFRNGPGHMFKKPAEDLLGLTDMNQFLVHLKPQEDSATIFQRAIRMLEMSYRVGHGTVADIPEVGPVTPGNPTWSNPYRS